MADEEVEQFEITDYDLDNEFNINRPLRKLSKNQQIYGVWADDSDNEDQSSSRSSFKKSVGRHTKNYSDPIGFICGGVQQAGKDKPPKTLRSHKDKDDEGDEEEDDGEENTKTGKNVIRGSSSSSEEDEEMGRASFRNMSIGNMEGDIAGLRKKRNLLPPQLIQRGVGNWEKHTKGIGAKLLLQMGFQPGRGLGKDLQGIQAPIEATLRKGRGAIGAYGPEKLQKVSSLREEEKKAHGNEKDGGKSTGEVSQWRKEGGTSKKKKVRYFYKSIEEVLEQSKLPGKKREFSELTRVKVIDMTGPQQRVLSGYHAISGVQKPTDQWEIRKDKKFTNFALPELQHNLNLLVDMCEEAIIQNDRQLRYSEDRIMGVEAEVESLSKVVLQEEQIIAALETVLGRIELLSARAKDNTLTLKEAADAILELQEKYYTEYCMYEIPALATGIVRPLLKEHLATWNPLQDPTQPIATFQQWKDILESQPTHNYAQQTHDPYHRLLWDAWMPCVRIAVNAWKVRECTPMIELIEHWMPLIPAWILDNILQQLVLPKLQLEVEEWNPLTDTIPIHSWIHPWIPLLGKRLATQAFPVIRHKLSTALVSWHPSDRSARLMLQPWVAVFSQGEMDAFLVNHIVPKLHLALQELIINPHQQHLDNWQWVMDWSEILPIHVLASVLDASFFPKWLQVLTLWLNLNPNYDQVTNWYKQWKGMISDKLQQQPAIKEHFRSALDLMSRAVGGPVSQPPTESTQQSRYQGMAECVRTAAQIPQGFRELVEKRCEERGIVWLPLANRYREGKQIYRCGKLQVYIDRNVLFISDNGVSWDPASIQLLLERAV